MMVFVAAWLLSGAVAGLAAQPAAQSPQDQFVPVKSLPRAPSEQLPAQTLVMVAYVFLWAVLLVYVWTVWRRLLKVEKEIHALADRLRERGA